METTFLIAGILFLVMLVMGRFLLGKAPEVSAKDSVNSPEVKSPLSVVQLGMPENSSSSSLFPIGGFGVMENFYSNSDD